MGILIDLDGRDLRDGAVSGCETGVGEVGRLEFGQSLLVEFRLEILENGSESWTGKRRGGFTVNDPSPYPTNQLLLTQDFHGTSINSTFERRSRHDERGDKNRGQAN